MGRDNLEKVVKAWKKKKKQVWGTLGKGKLCKACKKTKNTDGREKHTIGRGNRRETHNFGCYEILLDVVREEVRSSGPRKGQMGVCVCVKLEEPLWLVFLVDSL